MKTMEIILIIAGAIVFIVSFLLPEKKSKNVSQKTEEAQIKKMVDREVESSKNRIEEVTDETITYAVEKTERFLDRLTNEKIMAVNEYSDTVLENIHKNHEEVMFLYDMLNNKHLELKQTVKEISKVTKEVRDHTERKEADLAEQKSADYEEQMITKQQETKSTEMKKTASREEVFSQKSEKNQADLKATTFIPLNPEKIELAPVSETKKKRAASTTKTAGKSTKENIKSIDSEKVSNTEVQFVAGQENISNSNEHILQLHKEGKSNMAIAKELGLGVGEVKLVIDLFEGM